MRRRALITGATGFVGGNLLPRLAAEGWELHALVRPTSDTRTLDRMGVRQWVGELRDREVLRRACGEVDVVFHLAAVTAARDQAAYELANVEGTRSVVEAIAGVDHMPGRLVYRGRGKPRRRSPRTAERSWPVKRLSGAWRDEGSMWW